MKSYVYTSVASLAVGAIAAWQLLPPPTAKIEYRDRVVVKTVRETRKTRTRETRKPDGTTVVERSETVSNTDTKSTGTSTVISSPAPRWSASVLGGTNLQLQPVAGAHLTYRVAGPFTVGAWGVGGNGTAAGGLSLGVVF